MIRAGSLRDWEFAHFKIFGTTSFAIGVGDGTTATATGLFNGALANGKNTTASSTGAFSLAYAVGESTIARTQGKHHRIWCTQQRHEHRRK